MTIDLNAIRARHHPVAGLRDDEGHLFEPATFCRHCKTFWPCDADALLAEVDRLERAVVEAEVARWNDVRPARAQAYAEGVNEERARIRAAVEGRKVKPRWKRDDNDWQKGYRDGWNDALAAVLAVIEGGE